MRNERENAFTREKRVAARDRSLNGTRTDLGECINTSALLAIYTRECYATTNLLQRDFLTGVADLQPRFARAELTELLPSTRHPASISYHSDDSTRELTIARQAAN
jgi:hypothetical protein